METRCVFFQSSSSSFLLSFPFPLFFFPFSLFFFSSRMDPFHRFLYHPGIVPHRHLCKQENKCTRVRLHTGPARVTFAEKPLWLSCKLLSKRTWVEAEGVGGWCLSSSPVNVIKNTRLVNFQTRGLHPGDCVITEKFSRQRWFSITKSKNKRCFQREEKKSYLSVINRLGF